MHCMRIYLCLLFVVKHKLIRECICDSSCLTWFCLCLFIYWATRCKTFFIMENRVIHMHKHQTTTVYTHHILIIAPKERKSKRRRHKFKFNFYRCCPCGLASHFSLAPTFSLSIHSVCILTFSARFLSGVRFAYDRCASALWFSLFTFIINEFKWLLFTYARKSPHYHIIMSPWNVS